MNAATAFDRTREAFEKMRRMKHSGRTEEAEIAKREMEAWGLVHQRSSRGITLH